jgi:coproporphyrinogen III oxidase
VESLYRNLQTDIVTALSDLDGTGFEDDEWRRSDGGGGLTRILSDGPIIEKAAVNFSAVHGAAPPALVEHLKTEATTFYATGISLIVHPRNPHAPTTHANLRYFETDGDGAWFGGGADLTPYYLYETDARDFHRMIRDVCRRHRVADYTAWKHHCDEYFYLAHRGEARGVGGIFFDHLDDDLEDVLAFQEDLGNSLMGAYLPILSRRSKTAYGESETRWHLQRRGRYAEFNLVQDRGTRFGLQTGGRIESILASLPPRVRWDYLAEPEDGTPEAGLLAVLRGRPREWV